MRDASVMTFYQGQFATNSAGRQLPQIYCSGGNACGAVDRIKSVQCFNKGVDISGKVNWRCESNIVGDDFTVDQTNPTCEGYSSPSDNEYAHSNSCICMVTLNYKTGSSTSGSSYIPSQSTTSNSSSSGDFFFGFLMFAGVLAFLVSSCCKNTNSRFPSPPSISSQVNNYVQSVASTVSSASNNLRHRNTSQQHTVVSHGTSNNSSYPSVPVQASVNQVQQTVVSHGTSNNSAYPSVHASQPANQQQTVVSHGTSNNSAYPAVQPSQSNQNNKNQQQTVISHGTSNNSAYPVVP
jgi:hypothetical protein